MPLLNAEVDYIDANTGALIVTLPFYDPGLDENSWLAIELKREGRWRGPHFAYSCGRRTAS